MTGLAALTKSCAASATAPGSPIGGAIFGSLGISSFWCGGIGPSCISLSSTSNTGAVGGVMAML